MSKALDLLKKSQSATSRAEQYAPRIATSIATKLIDPLKVQIEAIEDQIFDLENMGLDIDVNKGQRGVTKEQAEQRFIKIIELSYEKDLLVAQLKSYEKAYNVYFTDKKEK